MAAFPRGGQGRNRGEKIDGMFIMITLATAFAATVLTGVLLLPLLRRLSKGTIREDGPKWHESKQGTPLMGGLFFVVGTAAGVIAGYLCLLSAGRGPQAMSLFGGLTMALLFGLIGFSDDYIKVVMKRNLGLRARQKLILQALVAALYLVFRWYLGDRSTAVWIPFLGDLELGWFYYPLAGILLVGMVNAVNLNDGVDGLCGSVTMVAAVFFMLLTGLLPNYMEMHVMAIALAASCVGFLLFNAHPAKVFMGDTGSFFLGGVLCALGFGVRMEFLLFFCGFGYCCEALSDIIQVCYFKATHGKRFFKMAPIHHHFELCGWSENKIVIVFSLVTVLTSAIGLAAALLR